MEIPNAVIELLKSPELSFLPRYNREDIVATITFAMIDVAKTANPDININTYEVCETTLSLYRTEFKTVHSAHKTRINAQ